MKVRIAKLTRSGVEGYTVEYRKFLFCWRPIKDTTLSTNTQDTQWVGRLFNTLADAVAAVDHFVKQPANKREIVWSKNI